MQSLYNGGAERSLINLLNELPEDKYKIDILLFKREGVFMKQVPEFVKILDTPVALNKLSVPLKKSGKYIPVKVVGTTISRLAEREKKQQEAYRWKHYYTKFIDDLDEYYDVAIAYMSGEILYYLCDKVKAAKKFVWIHNDYRAAHHPREYDYPYLKQVDGIVSVSESCSDILKEEFPEFSDKIYYISNINSSEVIRKRAEEFVPVEFKTKSYDPIILSIGRLSPQKGFDIAVNAAYIMKNRGLHFTWFIIGDGPEEKNLKEAINEYGLNEYFQLLGKKENPYPYIKNCTIFAQTSRYEGKSMALDEAKILCRPILTTAYPTASDQIAADKEGVIVNICAEDIAAGLEKMITDASFCHELSDYLSMREFGNSEEVRKYMQLIDNNHIS